MIKKTQKKAGLVLIVIGVLGFSLIFAANALYPAHGDDPAAVFARTDGKLILVDDGTGFSPFEIRGVDLGSGYPGAWAGERKIDRDTYLRWLELIRDMGANTVRVYTVQSPGFYEAFFDYNQELSKSGAAPLYLLHGVWADMPDDALSEDFVDTFISGVKEVVDIIHGSEAGISTRDISEWVLGYIVGVEWEPYTVTYTNLMHTGYTFRGDYLSADVDASPFEAMLARVGDAMTEYETERYGAQRLLAFTNWADTDPFRYPERIENYYDKRACVDAEHIKAEDGFAAGQFASYHVYPYYPDYLCFARELALFPDEAETAPANSPLRYIGESDLYDETGGVNTYRAYLTALNRYHSIPVVISEFGVPSGRGISHSDVNTGRNQGFMSESEQGSALVRCYEDIVSAGCAGCCLFSWHDEWFKTTWNTANTYGDERTAYWFDAQTPEEHFGVLALEPGSAGTVTIDGDDGEWTGDDVISGSGDMTVSAKFDEGYLYICVRKEGWDIAGGRLFIPIDVTPLTGSRYCIEHDALFELEADFLAVIDGEENSRVLVQERYEYLRSAYADYYYGFETYADEYSPSAHSAHFVPIYQILNIKPGLLFRTELFETGRLRYGAADPDSAEYNSLADFCCDGGTLELRLPWSLINFCDPSEMRIYGDFYDPEGGGIFVDSICVGAGEGDGEIAMYPVSLRTWMEEPAFHERLKTSYYCMKEAWNG